MDDRDKQTAGGGLPPQASDPQVADPVADIGIDPTLAQGQKSASEAASEGSAPQTGNSQTANPQTGIEGGFVGSAQEEESEAYLQAQGADAVAESDVSSAGEADIESARPFGRDDGSEPWH